MGNTVKIDLDKLKEAIKETYEDPTIITITEIMEVIVAKCVEPPKEAVNHPEHYNSGKHECIEMMRACFGDNQVMSFCKLNAYKYRFRASHKNGEEDIRKAEWYEDYLISMQKGEK